MVAEPAVAQAANPSPFVRIEEGLGPQELYYCQLETMLGTLLGRLLVMGLYCLLIAGWQGALIGMALLLVLGWGQILRHKDRPDLLRYNYHRNIWLVVFFSLGPLLMRLVYALLEAKAPNVLDGWLQFTTPVMEHLSRHLSIFQEMRNMHALLFAATEPAKIPRLDLALHMNMVHWLSIPAVFLFAPLLGTYLRQIRPLTGRDYRKLIVAFLLLRILFMFGLLGVDAGLGETDSFRNKSMQFSISTSLSVQIGAFSVLAGILLYDIAFLRIIFDSMNFGKKFPNFTQKYLPFRAG